jgi:hypothetical protein
MYDCWQMAKAELKYWELIKYFLQNSTYADKITLCNEMKEEASNATSIGQFLFWYLNIIGTLMIFSISWHALLVLGCIMLLHYTGLEDILFFVWANIIPLPNSWWESHKDVRILGIRFPIELPWLAKNRTIGNITIGRGPIIFLTGEEIDAVRLITLNVSIIIIMFIAFL